MRKTPVIFCCLILLSLACFSQRTIVPGYQGKRMALSYELQTFPVFLIFGKYKSESYDYPIRLLNKHNLTFDYALGRRFTLGGSAGVSYAKVIFGEDNYYRPVTQLHRTKAAYYTLNFRFFFPNFVAPVGIYYEFNIGQVRFGLSKEDGIEMRSFDPYSSTSTIEIKSAQPYTSLILGMGFANRTILGKRFTFTKGIYITGFFGGDIPIIPQPTDNNWGAGTNTRYIPHAIGRMIRWENLFSYKLGIGYLAF